MTDTLTAQRSFVAYYRVSTTGQGESGLGLDAQRLAVSAYLATVADSDCIAELTEIESGKRKDRPQLAEAMKIARHNKATLVIAKLLALVAAPLARQGRSGRQRAASKPMTTLLLSLMTFEPFLNLNDH